MYGYGLALGCKVIMMPRATCQQTANPTSGYINTDKKYKKIDSEVDV